ncbi:PREDICTED: collagen alpha-1(II) chain-like [Condylura cristata]|uniref:collagen alpha-1(II) chain-like n=1 Tax=Condylura cristata TaxID=143302 RepID=UPI00064319AD|nr:PREDICTED: collagen alpha-1(II) chain-like [Condylura cristata]
MDSLPQNSTLVGLAHSPIASDVRMTLPSEAAPGSGRPASPARRAVSCGTAGAGRQRRPPARGHHVVHDLQRKPAEREQQVPLRLGPAARPPDRHAGAAAAAGGAGGRPGQEHGALPPHARPLPGRLHRPAHGHEVPVRAAPGRAGGRGGTRGGASGPGEHFPLQRPAVGGRPRTETPGRCRGGMCLPGDLAAGGVYVLSLCNITGTEACGVQEAASAAGPRGPRVGGALPRAAGPLRGRRGLRLRPGTAGPP